MTPEQLAAVKAYILADQVLSTKPNNSDGAFDIARELNKLAVPDYYVWRTSVNQDEITQNGFDWVRVDNLSIGKARIWDWLFKNSTNSINPSKTNVRAGIDECWKGTAADLAVRATVYLHCYRPATVVEKLLASGLGTTASPSTMGYEGSISYMDVEAARAL